MEMDNMRSRLFVDNIKGEREKMEIYLIKLKVTNSFPLNNINCIEKLEIIIAVNWKSNVRVYAVLNGCIFTKSFCKPFCPDLFVATHNFCATN
jgi:hypothetical protein